jgi:hypothetical protein
MVGVVIPTCDSARRVFLNFLFERLRQQTRQPDYVALVDHPNLTGKNDISQRYIKGINECFGKGCDLVLLMEDDDYYPVTYIEEMYNQWRASGRPVLIGADRYTYYHIFEKGYKHEMLKNHSSAFTSAVAPGVNFKGTEDAMLFDLVLWKKNKGKLVALKDNPIGIKHGIGACGGGGHTKRFYHKFDNEASDYLRGVVDQQGFDFYTNLRPQPLTLDEWHDVLRRALPVRKPVRVAWALDSSYAGFPFIVNYLDCVPVVYNRRLEYFDKLVWGLRYYMEEPEIKELIEQADHLYLFGAKGAQYFVNLFKLPKNVTYIISDSWHYKDAAQNRDKIRKALSKINLTTFVMPDIAGQSDVHWDYLYYQSLPIIPRQNNAKQLIVGHSPGLKLETNEKGTNEIQQVCKELKVQLNIISGVSWQEAQRMKSECTVFVDQLITKNVREALQWDTTGELKGGLGKSGLEAMLLGACVITSGRFASADDFPAPPVVIVNTKAELKKALTKLKNHTERKRLAKLQQDWALKYTNLQFNLERFGVKRIEQIYTSYTLKSFEERMKTKYNLREVTDPREPVVIFGMYRYEDYLFAQRHDGEKVILWAGTDVTYLERLYRDFLPIEGRHIAISENVQRRLAKQGIKADYIPVTPTEIKADPQPRGECVYFYGEGENYGESLFNEIKKRIKYRVIHCKNRQHKQEKMRDIYRKCFMGLRLTPRDGMPNTVIEMGLMGRRCLWNCGYLPNAIKYPAGNVDEIIRLIDQEYINRTEAPEPIAEAVADYLTTAEDSFLYVKENRNEVKILAIAFVWNEREYLPKALEYYRKQGLDVYVIDNYSDDGTWQYLQEQGIASHRFDTHGAFHLTMLQDEMKRVLDLQQPDWFVWFSPDLFHIFTRLTVRQAVETASMLGFNQIKSECYHLKPTGETGGFENYRYAERNNRVLLISQYDKDITFRADKIIHSDAKIIEGGVILEYGAVKPREQQEAKMKRRMKAWDMGMNGDIGEHYKRGQQNGWKYDSKELTDILRTEHKHAIQKLYEIQE